MQNHNLKHDAEVCEEVTIHDLLTEHACKRMDQRGLKQEAIEVALTYGRRIHSRRALYYVVGQKEIREFGKICPEIKELDGLQVLMDSESKHILTVYRNHDLRQIRPKKRKHSHLH